MVCFPVGRVFLDCEVCDSYKTEIDSSSRQDDLLENDQTYASLQDCSGMKDNDVRKVIKKRKRGDTTMPKASVPKHQKLATPAKLPAPSPIQATSKLAIYFNAPRKVTFTPTRALLPNHKNSCHLTGYVVPVLAAVSWLPQIANWIEREATRTGPNSCTHALHTLLTLCQDTTANEAHKKKVIHDLLANIGCEEIRRRFAQTQATEVWWSTLCDETYAVTDTPFAMKSLVRTCSLDKISHPESTPHAQHTAIFEVNLSNLELAKRGGGGGGQFSAVGIYACVYMQYYLCLYSVDLLNMCLEEKKTICSETDNESRLQRLDAQNRILSNRKLDPLPKLDLDLLREVLGGTDPEKRLPAAMQCGGMRTLTTKLAKPPLLFGVAVHLDNFAKVQSLRLDTRELEFVFGWYVHESTYKLVSLIGYSNYRLVAITRLKNVHYTAAMNINGDGWFAVDDMCGGAYPLEKEQILHIKGKSSVHTFFYVMDDDWQDNPNMRSDYEDTVDTQENTGLPSTADLCLPADVASEWLASLQPSTPVNLPEPLTVGQFGREVLHPLYKDELSAGVYFKSRYHSGGAFATSIVIRSGFYVGSVLATDGDNDDDDLLSISSLTMGALHFVTLPPLLCFLAPNKEMQSSHYRGFLLEQFSEQAAEVGTPLVRKMYRLSSVIQLVNDQMTFVSAKDLVETDRFYDYLVATFVADDSEITQ